GSRDQGGKNDEPGVNYKRRCAVPFVDRRLKLVQISEQHGRWKSAASEAFEHLPGRQGTDRNESGGPGFGVSTTKDPGIGHQNRGEKHSLISGHGGGGQREGGP